MENETQHPAIKALDGLGAAADASGAPAPETIPEGAQNGEGAGGPDFAMEAAKAVDFLSAGIVGFAPQAESIWTPETKARVSLVLAPVFAKYGVDTAVLPCELVALVVVGPPIWASVKIVLAKIEADKSPEARADKQDAKAQDGLAAEITGASEAASDVAPGPKVAPQVALFKQ